MITWYWPLLVAFAAAYAAVIICIFVPRPKRLAPPPVSEPDPDYVFLPSGFAIRQRPVTYREGTIGDPAYAPGETDITTIADKERKTYYSRRYEPS